MNRKQGFTPLEKINAFNRYLFRFNPAKTPLSPVLSAKKFRSLTGFTLIEITIVVLIIGILATIAIPTYRRSLERAKCSQAMQTLREIRSAALDWYRENENFIGTTIDDLEDQVGANFQIGADNPDWIFTFTSDNFQFTATADRQNGPHGPAAIGGDGRTTLTLDRDEAWSDPAVGYPWDNP